MSFKTDINAVKSRLVIFQLMTMVGFVLVAIALIYWSIISGPDILARDDNPRLVEEELSIERGRILDANNVILAESLRQEDGQRRNYPVEGMGPVVGYYSLRHGTTGIESSYDPLLRGDIDDFWSDFWRRTQHQNQVGRDVQLTIDARLQQLANSLIGDEKGAILLFSIPEAEIKALVSGPNYDPNELDEQFDELVSDEEAPLLNRVTQGQYQPGMLLQPFIIASALEDGLISMEQTVEGADEAIVVNGTNLQCNKSVNIQATWREILEGQCPAAMIQLANRLGNNGLSEVFSKFGFTVAPSLEIDTEVGDGLNISDIQMAAIGQDNLSVSPLQVGLALAALANNVELPNPQLVLATENLSSQWVQEEVQPIASQAVDAESARALLESFSGQNGMAEYPIMVLSGPEGTTNAWYLGLIPEDSPAFGIVVVIEDVEDTTIAEQIGRKLLVAARELSG
jgi:peptidoglycan glycosyltransferase